jgi:hypothetical protein
MSSLVADTIASDVIMGLQLMLLSESLRPPRRVLDENSGATRLRAPWTTAHSNSGRREEGGRLAVERI